MLAAAAGAIGCKSRLAGALLFLAAGRELIMVMIMLVLQLLLPAAAGVVGPALR
jgi:hypothetical protein